MKKTNICIIVSLAAALSFSSCTKLATPTEVTADPTPTGGYRITSVTGYHENGMVAAVANYSYGTGATPTAASAFIYDDTGALIITQTINYDINGTTLNAVISDGTGTTTMTITSEMAGGLVTRLNLIDGNSVLQAYVIFQYNGAGLMTKQEVYSGTGVLQSYQTKQYNAAGQVTQEQLYSGATLAQSVSYIYDALGRISRKTDDISGSYNVCVYNALGKVATETAYDQAGIPQLIGTNIYDANGFLTGMQAVQPPSTVMMDATYTNDANGNPLDVIMTSYTPVGSVFHVTMTWESY